jgi:hypothetical protein
MFRLSRQRNLNSVIRSIRAIDRTGQGKVSALEILDKPTPVLILTGLTAVDFIFSDD